MKTQIKLLAIQIILASTMLFTFKVNAQCFSAGLAVPLRTEVQGQNGNPFMVLNQAPAIFPCITTGIALTGVGINTVAPNAPNYMLDILCDPSNGTNSDINVSTTAATQNVGYRIGGNMFLWHNGITSDVFCGVSAGGPTPSGTLNTFVGNLAGFSNTGNTNTFIGYAAGYSNVTGGDNVYVGTNAGYLNTNSYNTFTGYEAGKNNYGKANNYYGKEAGNLTLNGSSFNCYFGNHTGDGEYMADSNNCYGDFANYNPVGGNIVGNGNTYIGMYAAWNAGSSNLGFSSSNDNVYIGNWVAQNYTSGNGNVVLGYKADIYNIATPTTPILNSAALGDYAIVNYNNQFILGNNSQFVGIGESDDQSFGYAGPQWNLEICTEHNPTYSMPGLGGGVYNAPNPYLGTGFSGLKFRDLTSNSQTVSPSSFTDPKHPYPKGVLSVDGYGNVIYIPTCCDSGSGGGSGGFGTCCTPNYFPAPGETCNNDPTIDLMSPTSSNPYAHNLWVEGNQMGKFLTNTYMGYTCPQAVPAKLSVFQNSGDYSTICGYFENHDLGLCGVSSSDPVIAIEALNSNVGSASTTQTQIAGWFQSQGNRGCCNSITQYAIVVPQGGGNVEIGVPGASTTNIQCPNIYMLDVYGSAFNYTTIWASDSTIKTNDTAITNPLAVIGKLKGYGFNYIHSATYDSGMAGRHYGFLSQQVARVLPNLVKTDRRGIKGVAYLEIIPWLVEGMKQQKLTIDSLRTNLAKLTVSHDSLRTLTLGYIRCLDSLCGSSHHAPIRGNGNGGGGNGNSTGNTNPNNSQDVTLSMSSEPILYQNTPNPFSTGTAINYFLPEGTMGAKMLFFDSYGKQLKSVELSQTGNGTLNITPDNLQSGIYSYSLIVNDKVVDTKRMVLQK